MIFCDILFPAMIEHFITELDTALDSDTALEQMSSYSQQSSWEVHLDGLEGFPLARVITRLHRQFQCPFVVVSSSEDQAKMLVRDMKSMGADPVRFPSNGQSLLSFYQGDYDTTQEQIAALSRLTEQRDSVLVTTLRASAMPVKGIDLLTGSRYTFTIGDSIDTEVIAETLSRLGYERVPRTTVHGEFTLRGEVLDLFPPEAERPCRLAFGWNEIESIHRFDPLTQMIHGDLVLKSLSVIPASVDAGTSFGHLSDLFSGEEVCLLLGESALDHGWQSLQREAREAYRSAYSQRLEPQRVEDVLSDPGESFFKQPRRYILDDIRNPESKKRNIHFSMQGPRSFFGNMHYFREEMQNLLEADYQVFLFCGSKQQLERISHLMRDIPVELVEEDISGGFTLPDVKLTAVTESEIFGRKKRHASSLTHTASSPLDTFVELNPGDYIVHIQYGIGRFIQIERIHAAGKERDYIKIEYAKGETVFIPIEQVNLLQKYIGKDGRPPSLDVIGGTSWETKKNRVRKSVEDLAQHLISLYAQRERQRGFPFPKDTDLQIAFEASFPFEETEDQLACIADVKIDMESPEPMDRLICGDVGFGKTEVALRASFKAVAASKQVAFLAPTTILAEQHYETLKDRNRGFPIEVAMLSRLVDPLDQKRVLKDVREGRIDILVGTHRILQKDVIYKDLGLMIVDEEQRFGVKDKEKIKEYKISIDSLSLSATPIPRTLYMSLLKIRDMSLLTTPPLQRIPIHTVIHEFDEQLIVEAIQKEIDRGGQVFYLHNRVKTLQKSVMTLQKLLPHISIQFAHGQMAGHQIEERMRGFINGSYQVLVSTTIIENGIDISNVNTIIIDRADHYGVSQLYQLRGRVGRSDQQAYAYLLFPQDKAITETAMKRLKIISEHTELGSGFKIAMRDMEVRGTGNLLGREQHGQMASVGLDMYLHMLDKAVAKLSSKDEEPEQEMLLDLDYSGYIPDSYISDVASKFEVYKKMSSVHQEKELQNITAMLESTYGHIPDEVANLLYIAELRIIGRKLSIASLRERQGKVRVEFSRVAGVSVERVLSLITESGGHVRLDPNHPQVLLMSTSATSLKDKSLFILEKLQRLL